MLNKLGRYDIKGEVGRGGMATVYRGYDPMFEREVAIKIIPQQFLNDPSFRNRFEREAKTIAMLEHPGILPVYDFGEENNQPYIVMRLITGGTLIDYIKRQPLTLKGITRIVKRIAAALDYAHSKGVIHRDLKPANILFDNEDNPYIADFGLAKLTVQTSGMTGSSILGTPSYMSPEQARGETDLDGRSDIYSLGVIVYEMLTGQQPYHAETPFGVAMKHISTPVPQLRDINPALPITCQEIINVAMSKDRNERFTVASEIAQRLETISNGETPHPYKPSDAIKNETNLTSFNCPNCSAPIELPHNAKSTKCAYCNASIVIPNELQIYDEESQKKKSRTINETTKPESAPPSPPPELPHYGKQFLGAEATATLTVCILSCIVLTLFALTLRTVDLNQLKIISLADQAATTKSTTATPAAASTLANATSAAPTNTTLFLDGRSIFQDPQALSFDGGSNFYVSDKKAAQLFRFDLNGKLLNQWKIETKNNLGSNSLAADRFGNVYAVQDGIILKYNGITGVLQDRITDSNGIGFSEVATLQDGGFAASLSANNRDEIVRFNSNAQVIFRINKAISGQANKNETHIHLATDAAGDIYAIGGDNNIIVKYSPDGKFLIKFGVEGAGLGQFQSITSLAVDNGNRIYVSDLKGIQIFDSNGKYLSLISSPNGGISSITLNASGELFGAIGNKIYKFNLK